MNETSGKEEGEIKLSRNHSANHGENRVERSRWSPDRCEVGGQSFRLLISPEEIAEGVRKVAERLNDVEEYRVEGGEPAVLLCVLKGATIFFADLIRLLTFRLQLGFIRVSSYGDRMTSSGSLTITPVTGTEIDGRNVIVIEDIIDTGRTATGLSRWLLEQGARSVRIVSLLFKPEVAARESAARTPDLWGIEIPDQFVIGYGLDFAEAGRNLPGIYVLEQKQEGE